MINDVIREARALGLSEKAVQAVVLTDTLDEAREIVALCKFAGRDLADEYVGRPLKALHARLTNDRAAADEELHVDTSPRVALTVYERREAL